jgi:hypothetical protein
VTHALEVSSCLLATFIGVVAVQSLFGEILDECGNGLRAEFYSVSGSAAAARAYFDEVMLVGRLRKVAGGEGWPRFVGQNSGVVKE